MRPSFFINNLIKSNLRIKMKALSQSEYGELRNLYESIYTPKVDLSEEILDEIFDELIEELIEEGYEEDEAISLVEEATDSYIDEAKVTFGSDTAPMRASGAPVGARRRYGMRKAGEALQKAGSTAKGAVDSAKGAYKTAKAVGGIAGSIAKDEAKRAGRAAKQAVTSAPGKVMAAVEKKKQETKRGIKGFIKRQAQKVVNRMSEENIQEIYKGRHGQSDKEYADSRSQGGKMVSGTSKMSGAEYTHGRRVKAANPGMQPDVGGKTKPKSQGKMDRGTRADLEYRKANLKKEELEATGLFTTKEIEAIMEAEMSEAMSSYDRNRKRAAERAAARNAARDAGKTGVVPGVGYVTPRRERETYVDSAGITRHKSGAKMPKD